MLFFRPERSHYFPTLYQHLYEMEDGFTASTGPIRYGFEDDVFPMYSWKGYAIFSRIQVRRGILDGFEDSTSLIVLHPVYLLKIVL